MRFQNINRRDCDCGWSKFFFKALTRAPFGGRSKSQNTFATQNPKTTNHIKKYKQWLMFENGAYYY
jgi:hypothetical protein